MAMRQNFLYSDPAIAATAQNLGTMIFGNPDDQEARELRRAQAGLARANTIKAQQEAEAARAAATARAGLGGVFRNILFDDTAGPPTAEGVGPAPVRVAPDVSRARAATALGDVAQAYPDKPGNLGDVMRTILALSGDDALARSGMVAGGATPGENFALTPERADAISARDAAESQSQAIAVENIRSGDRRYAADARASAPKKFKMGGKDLGEVEARVAETLGVDLNAFTEGIAQLPSEQQSAIYGAIRQGWDESEGNIAGAVERGVGAARQFFQTTPAEPAGLGNLFGMFADGPSIAPRAQPEAPTTGGGNKMPPLGTEVVGRTPEGRPIIKNPDGSFSSERTITIGVDGGFLNIPTMFGGKEVSPDEAVEIMRRNNWVDPETGRKMTLFPDEAAALAAASQRSNSLGRNGRPAPAPAAPPAAAPASVPPPAQRKKGTIYQTPKGPMIWTGTGWKPAGPNA